MSTTILRAEHEVQHAIEAGSLCAEPKEATLAAVESELWTALPGLGN